MINKAVNHKVKFENSFYIDNSIRSP